MREEEIKVFVFAYNRYDTMTTSNMLLADGVEHYVVCHSQRDVDKFKEGGTLKIDDSHIIVTNNPRGLTRQRNYVLDHCMEEGQWALFMNDDLVEVTAWGGDWKANSINITKQNIKYVDSLFKTRLSMEKFLQLCKQETEGNNTLIGFSAHNNTMFRSKKYSKNCLVDGRCILFKKTKLRFDENVGVLEDHEFTAANIVNGTGVKVDNWICPRFKRMTEGGFGTLKEREPELKKEAAYLIAKYPFLFEYKDKKGYPPKTQLRFKHI